MLNNNIKIALILVLILFIGIFFWQKREDKVSKDNLSKKAIKETITIETGAEVNTINTENTKAKEFAFKGDGFITNTAKRSIDLEEVLDGGPGKDGIPPLTNPKFVSIQKATKFTKDNVRGLVIEVDSTVKFYSYNIMVWHEIVNDVVADKPLLITFCPLCGSAIVFDTPDLFGVSGKLYESNLLMYDKKTESFWSQAIGTAVIGDRLGEKLPIYPVQVLPFKVFKEKWPNGLVLSTDTGYNRNYNVYPYGDYDSNDDIFFPVSVKDSRFPAKEIMYVINTKNKSVAFPIKQLGESIVSVNVEDEEISAQIKEGEIVAKDETGKILPGYYEMWFSWATHHQKDGIVWIK